MILIPLAVFLSVWIKANHAPKALSGIAAGLSETIPQKSIRYPTPEDTDLSMPVMIYEGCDYIALLEVPGRGVLLPVRAKWDSRERLYCPCRYTGSAYDGTLVIGGTETDGQFAFTGTVDMGDTVILRDMRGREFHYEVSIVRHAGTLNAKNPASYEADLVLFSSAVFGSGHKIVLCTRIPFADE